MNFGGFFNINAIIKDWSPANNLRNVGPMFTTKAGDYYETLGYGYDA
jgi:hypothetical protein